MSAAAATVERTVPVAGGQIGGSENRWKALRLNARGQSPQNALGLNY